jgi:uncharacterized protein YqeY
MSLHQDIKGQMIEAMKAKEAVRLSVIRGLLSSFTNELVAKSRKTDEMLSDEEVIALISRAVKQRKDSIEQFEKGGRADLAESEKEELAVLQAYLPAQMSREEVFAFVQTKAATENLTKEKAGQFMGAVMKDLKGKTDGGMVKEAVDSLFV